MRTLGRSGVPVSPLGFGAAGIGNLYTALGDEQAYDTVRTAWQHGTRYFDTAPHYGLGLSVVVGGAFNSGLLADPRPGARYDYAQAPAALLERARRLRSVADRHGITLRAAALAFCAAHPAVASVLVGARSADEARDCAEQFESPVPAAFWQELRDTGLLRMPVPGEPS
ncbi:aldo/keto reductase [Streptomyces sp. NPDC004542]|uniref:aldo/keto reductase family protein n=1 Tax=Streptomyces sp. NPDC004542 TaxID=3154281 RepID=UPI0033BE9CD5